MKIANIVIDCADPRLLAHFWSDVLGYPRMEYPDDMRRELLASGLTEDDLLDRAVAEDPAGEGQRFYFQRVPEAKLGKNRVHVDIRSVPGRRAEPHEVDAEVERITGLGATVLRKVAGSWGPYSEYFYVLADLEGNEFCVC